MRTAILRLALTLVEAYADVKGRRKKESFILVRGLTNMPVKGSACGLQETVGEQAEELPRNLEFTIGGKLSRLASPVG